MFASLSSFLPSAVQQVVQTPRPSNISAPSSSSTAPDDPADPEPPRKKGKKERHANEAFIIVRPPPSKSVQPLSLQVQLVPPQSRHDRPVQALDSSPDDNRTDLKRTHSIGSEASATSGYTSAGSVSSFASTTTSTSISGRRMIIPLYNLNVHSVMPTTILDAGTDAKVAKFAKRGLEIIGLAFLEPIEARPSVPAQGSLALRTRASFDDSLHEFGATPFCRSPSPNRPNTSHAHISTSDPLKSTFNSLIAPPLAPPDPPPQRSSKKLFGRVFKKKDPSPLSITVPLPDDTNPQPSPLRNNISRPEEPFVPHVDTPHHHDSWPSTPLSGVISHTGVLGVHPTLYPPTTKGRPTKYIWVVRKWLKGVDTSILNGMMGKLSAGARDASVLNTPHIEVRFEWSREPKKGSVSKSGADKSPNSRDSQSPRNTPSNALPRFGSHSLSPETRDHRCSVLSHTSSGSDTAGSCTQAHPEESDYESDPEDSETPWTCTVVVQRLGQPQQHRQNGNGRDSAVRLKVATLAPTPHHPKVVGLLKIPFPLPDLEVERLAIRRRHVTVQGISKTTSPKAGEFILTAEEIKDTVSSTALWLVVREAFGGVGRERKKGKS